MDDEERLYKALAQREATAKRDYLRTQLIAAGCEPKPLCWHRDGPLFVGSKSIWRAKKFMADLREAVAAGHFPDAARDREDAEDKLEILLFEMSSQENYPPYCHLWRQVRWDGSPLDEPDEIRFEFSDRPESLV
jgi:hypothetical protein